MCFSFDGGGYRYSVWVFCFGNKIIVRSSLGPTKSQIFIGEATESFFVVRIARKTERSALAIYKALHNLSFSLLTNSFLSSYFELVLKQSIWMAQGPSWSWSWMGRRRKGPCPKERKEAKRIAQEGTKGTL